MTAGQAPPSNRSFFGLWLDLITRTLTGAIYEDPSIDHSRSDDNRFAPFNYEKRFKGVDWPQTAPTMVGIERLAHFGECISSTTHIPGDVVECGVWRGGASILAALLLEGLRSEKEVWLYDSFDGLPPPRCKEDEGLNLHLIPDLAVPIEEVARNFQRYHVGDRVRFVKGWFINLKNADKPAAISVLRIDCDLYESTRDVLQHLYPLLSPEGICIIDDFHIKACRTAVFEYVGEGTPFEYVGCSAWWKKS